jgi:glycosyltransferase involved in cell wall biosynthesis
MKAMRVAVAIPCYKVTRHVLGVINAIPGSVERIYAVDDACPDGSGAFIKTHCTDPRVRVLFHDENQGVGGAIATAYRQAIQDDVDVVVKIDGDGQMDPRLLPFFVRPIMLGLADYTKGNRFFRPESVGGMPFIRLFGNATLSFLTKLTCGYWRIMDPTNGYTAIHITALRELPLDKLEKRYFFESDMLFRLNTLRAVVRDVPMDSVYADEQSGLRIKQVLPEFMRKHASRLWRRYVYNYLVRDFNVGSLYSIFGVVLLLAGVLFGGWHWIESIWRNQPATSGTGMLSAMPIMVGIQFLIAFLHYDVSSAPTEPLSRLLGRLGEPDLLEASPATGEPDA